MPIDRLTKKFHHIEFEKKIRDLYNRWMYARQNDTKSIPNDELQYIKKGYVQKFELNEKGKNSKHLHTLEKILEIAQNTRVASNKSDFKKMNTGNYIIWAKEAKGYHLMFITEGNFNKYFNNYNCYQFFDKLEEKSRRGKDIVYYRVKPEIEKKYFKKVISDNYERLAIYYIYPELISEHEFINNKFFGRDYLWRYIFPEHNSRKKYKRSKVKKQLREYLEDISDL